MQPYHEGHTDMATLKKNRAIGGPRKGARQALRESEERYRLLFQGMLEGVAYCKVIYDDQGRPIDWVFVEVNRALEQLLGMTNLVGKRASQLFPGLTESDAELLEIYGRVARTGQPGEFEGYVADVGMWLRISAFSPAKGYFVAIGENITERKRAEQALRISEEQNRALVSAVPDLLFRVNRQGIFLDYHAPPGSMLYAPPEAFLGKTMTEVLPPAVAEAAMKAVELCLGSGESVKFEYPLTLENRERVFEDRTIPLSDQEVLFVIRDITDRKQAEEALRASQARLDFLLSSTPAVIYSAKLGGDYGATFISANITAQLGYEPSDFTSDSAFWINHIHPQDRDRVLAGLEHLSVGGFYAHDYRFLHKDGNYRWMRDEMRVVRDSAGHQVELVGYWIDITERKRAEEALQESEQRFRRLSEANILGIMTANLHAITAANDEFLRMVGYTREDLEGGRINWRDMTPPEFAKLDRRALAQLRARGWCTPFEKEFVHKDGHRVPILIGASLVDREAFTSICFVLDLTERKRLEQENRRAAVLAERNRLARDVHDNLAQGLTGIVLHLEGAEEVLDTSPREARKRIAKARDLARTSLEEARRSLLEMRSALLECGDLVSAVKQVINAFGDATSAHVALSVRGSPQPLPVPAEEALLRIAQEGLQNAVRHANPSQIRVELGYDDATVSLRIEDNGKGFRPNGRRKTGGLGLSFMKERCAEVGARFDIQSHPGKGTCVTVRLPVEAGFRRKLRQ